MQRKRQLMNEHRKKPMNVSSSAITIEGLEIKKD